MSLFVLFTSAFQWLFSRGIFQLVLALAYVAPLVILVSTKLVGRLPHSARWFVFVLALAAPFALAAGLDLLSPIRDTPDVGDPSVAGYDELRRNIIEYLTWGTASLHAVGLVVFFGMAGFVRFLTKSP